MFRKLVMSTVGILSIGLNACGTENYTKTAQSRELLREETAKANEPTGNAGGGSGSGYGEAELNTESKPPEMGDMRLALDKPFLSLAPRPDTQVSFYAWNDGSAGVLETNTSQVPLATDHPDLEKASPAEIFWALSTPGTEVPSLLREHHRDTVNSEGRKSFSEVTKEMNQGWARGATSHGGAPCSNAYFQRAFLPPSARVRWRSMLRRYKH